MSIDNYIQTLKHIKEEILRSRYNIAKVANKEMLFLYFKVGNVISVKVANEAWGSKTIQKLSIDLQNELKGLRGFSYANLKKMRQFYEEWSPYILASFTGTPGINDTLTASSGAMSFRFVSDNSGVSSGWYARWASNDFVLNLAEKKFNLQVFKLFPNPVNNKLYAEISVLKDEKLNIKLINIDGACLKETYQTVKPGNSTLNLSNLVLNIKPGNYFISISSANFRLTKKILKL